MFLLVVKQIRSQNCCFKLRLSQDQLKANSCSIVLPFSALIGLRSKAILSFQYDWKPTFYMFFIYFQNRAEHIQPSCNIFPISKPTGTAEGTASQIAMVLWESGVAVSYKWLKKKFWNKIWKKKRSRGFTKLRHILKHGLAVLNDKKKPTTFPVSTPTPNLKKKLTDKLN